MFGDADHVYRLASITKPLTAWATLVAVEEGIVTLDEPLRGVDVQDGCTLRHLLSHAGGYPFDGGDTDRAARAPADLLEHRVRARRGRGRRCGCGMPFAEYLHEAVFEPLGMASIGAARVAGPRCRGPRPPISSASPAN